MLGQKEPRRQRGVHRGRARGAASQERQGRQRGRLLHGHVDGMSLTHTLTSRWPAREERWTRHHHSTSIDYTPFDLHYRLSPARETICNSVIHAATAPGSCFVRFRALYLGKSDGCTGGSVAWHRGTLCVVSGSANCLYDSSQGTAGESDE